MDWLWFAAPALPLLTRAVLCVWFRRQMAEELTQEELDRDAHRGVLLALAGFSAAALLALATSAGQADPKLRPPVYFLATAFLAHLLALNAQSHKHRRWHDLMATAATEAGTLALVLAVAATVWRMEYGPAFSWGVAVAGAAVWAHDHVLRLVKQTRYLRKRRETRGAA